MIRLFGKRKKKPKVSKKKLKIKKTKVMAKKTLKKRIKVVKKIEKKRVIKPKKIKKPVKKIKEVKPEKIKAKKVVKPVINKMPDEDAYALLKRYKIPVVPYSFCKNEKELSSALKNIGFPCVLKVSGDIIHKTDVGGIRLNIKNEEEAKKTFNELMKIKGCKKVLVQKMMMDGYELIVGGKRDPQFNCIVALGAGGVFTEVLKDVEFRICPLSRMDAEEMLNEVKLSSLILSGFRGKPPADKNSIIDVILSVSRIMEKNKKIKELDINPLFTTSKNSFVEDIRIILE